MINDIESIKQLAYKNTLEWYNEYSTVEEYNQKKVLEAFRNNKVNYQDFQITSGYGMGDTGRDKLERIFSEIFRGEDALIRQQIVSGTHSITLALFAMLLPGDEMVIYGEPYDTLYKVLGTKKNDPGSLLELGIKYKIHKFGDENGLIQSVSNNTKVFYIQRSKGYSFRNAISIKTIERLIQKVRRINPDIIVFVDNCYGEFCEKKEPLEVGADLIAGSLIKNPGAGYAPAGGYLVGRKDLIERASFRLTAPGIGKEIGPSLISNSSLYQGIFSAPHVVAEALKGSVYAGSVFHNLGYDTVPGIEDERSDIVQAIQFENAQVLSKFCQLIQKYSPVDSHVIPEAWEMPGYEDNVIMATGGFVEGSSIELSADGPMREPYICYLQGGTSFTYIKLVIDLILDEIGNILRRD